jgi:hypothetical protein
MKIIDYEKLEERLVISKILHLLHLKKQIKYMKYWFLD